MAVAVRSAERRRAVEEVVAQLRAVLHEVRR